MSSPPKLLSIGGTDPCGAYGLLTDLKTFTQLGGHGMGVVTVVTAQNSVSWQGAEFVSADFVANQLAAVLDDYEYDGAKTGFLGRVDVIEAIAAKLREAPARPVVVDPVLVNQRGQRMFGDDVTAAYRRELWPLAHLITPNLDEAAVLNDQAIADPYVAIRELHQQLPPSAAVLLTGIDTETDMMDLLFDGEQMWQFTSPRLETPNTAGSGDTLSAAITTFLTHGLSLAEAVANGHQFTQQALAIGADWRLAEGSGPLGIPAVSTQ